MELSAKEPLRIIIVGAGLGGLGAALGLAQNGHTVTVFERSRLSSEVGAAVIVTPNSYACLKRLGITPEDNGAVVLDTFLEQNVRGEETSLTDVRGICAKNGWGHGVLAHRARLHAQLKAAALAHGAQLLTGSSVKEVTCDTPAVTLENGEVHEADVIIGADGIHSIVRHYITGDQYRPLHTNQKSAFRFIISMKEAQADPRTAEITGVKGRCVTWIDDDRRIIMYPTTNHEELNFVCIHPSKLSDTRSTEEISDSRSAYDQKATVENVLEVYKRFDPIATALLEKASSAAGLKAWNLLDMEELPTWVSGKTTILGDAAHPVVPFGFSGASMAIEDAVSLTVLLSRDLDKTQINSRLKLYEQCRKPRTTKVKDMSRIRGKDVGEGGCQDSEFDKLFFGFCFPHNEFKHSEEMFALHKLQSNETIGGDNRKGVELGGVVDPLIETAEDLTSTSRIPV